MFQKVLGISDVVWGMPYQWPEDVGQLLSHSTCDWIPAGNNRPKGGCVCEFWGDHKIWGDCTRVIKSMVSSVI